MSSHFERVAAQVQRSPGARITTATQVELVTGPPGSGKSTLVRERWREGDSLVDLDAIAAALTNGAKSAALMPAVWCARDAAMWALATEACPARVWVVACAPTRRERLQAVVPFASARLTVLEVPVSECVRRIAREQGMGGCGECGGPFDPDSRPRETGTDWRALVDAWWRAYRAPGQDEGWENVEVIRG